MTSALEFNNFRQNGSFMNSPQPEEESETIEYAEMSMLDLTHRLGDAELAEDVLVAEVIQKTLINKIDDYVFKVHFGGTYPINYFGNPEATDVRIMYLDGMQVTKELYKENKLTGTAPNSDKQHPSEDATENTVATADVPAESEATPIVKIPELIEDTPPPLENPIVKMIVGAPKIFKSVISDFNDGDLKEKTLVSGAVATWVLSAARTAEIFGPPTAVRIYTETGNKWLASAALAGIVYTQQNIFGASWAVSMDAMPKTMAESNTSFVEIAKVFQPDVPDGRVMKILSGLKQRFTALGMGTIPFVQAQKTINPSITVLESLKMSERISRKTAIAAGAIALTLISASEKWKTSGFVIEAVDYAKKPEFWASLSYGIIGLGILTSYVKYLRAKSS